MPLTAHGHSSYDRRRQESLSDGGEGVVGQMVSHCEILAKLGEDGMGVVCKAEDTMLRRSVALKFLRPDALESEEHER